MQLRSGAARFASIVILVMSLALTQVSAQSWREISIPTRVSEASRKYLAADLYANDSLTAKPVILIQTPYNKALYRLTLSQLDGRSGASIPYDSAHYNYVTVDWRGFWANKAANIPAYNRGLDGYDIVEWIAKQPWSNGKVGTWGGSALGFIQFQTAAQQPPHLVCAAPFIKDFQTKYEDYYYGGDFRREQTEALETLGFISVDTVLKHPTLDATWTFIEKNTDLSAKISVPLYMCSGWFDHYPDDVLRAFQDVQTKSDAGVKSQHKLVFGPYIHQGVGSAEQGILSYPGVEKVPTTLGLQFFDHYLRGLDNGWNNLPAVQYYMMGENTWKAATTWPSSGTRVDTLFFHSSQILDHTPPPFVKSLIPPDSLGGVPRKPVPTIGGSRFDPSDRKLPMGPQDISSLLSRSDVLAYSTEPLQSDLSILGSSEVVLDMQCSTADADISARLCDVYPDGRWVIITQGVQRLRFRNSLSSQELVNGDEHMKVQIHLQNTAQRFVPGHRLGLVFSTSNYPMFDINLNNGAAMYTAGDTQNTMLRIWHSQPYVSSFRYLTNDAPTEVDDEEEFVSSFEIQPNPATDLVMLHGRLNSSAPGRVKLVDFLGREIISRELELSARGEFSCSLSTAALASQAVLVIVEQADHTDTQVLHIVH